MNREFKTHKKKLRHWITILFVTSIHQFPNPRLFIDQNIYLFVVFSWNDPNFSKSWGGIKMHITHHSIIKIIITPNFVKNIFGLVKINWWIDATNKINKYWKINLDFLPIEFLHLQCLVPNRSFHCVAPWSIGVLDFGFLEENWSNLYSDPKMMACNGNQQIISIFFIKYLYGSRFKSILNFQFFLSN